MLGGAAAAPFVCRADNPFKSGIVCWTDEHGQRACGDHVPPQYAKTQRNIYDQRGIVIQTLKAEDTPEQRAEKERAAREAERLQQQQLNDNFMLQTYRNVDDLRAARDARLQNLDTRIELAQKAVKSGESGLHDLQDRVDSERNAGKEPDAALDSQIQAYEAAQAENIKALAQLQQDREAAAAQFERDIQRYQELHGGATPAAPRTPTAPQPTPAPSPSLATQPRE